MMKSAEDRLSSEWPSRWNGRWPGESLSRDRCVRRFVVIAGVGRKDPAQMGLAEDDDVIEAFTADRADQSLRIPFCQGDRGAIG